jgi:hypothetical protein
MTPTPKDLIVAYIKKHPEVGYAVIADKLGCHMSYVNKLALEAGIYRRTKMTVEHITAALGETE